MAKRRGLPDHIKPGVRVLFVGINPGMRSAALGHHFAGYSNRFWKLLWASGLVTAPLTFVEDWRLPEWGFGLTNLVAKPTPGIDSLSSGDYAAGRARLLSKICRYRPKVVALLGMTLYSVLCPVARGGRIVNAGARPRRRLGLQPDTLAGARVFLLPNPSGRNAHYSYLEMVKAYRGLKTCLARLE